MPHQILEVVGIVVALIFAITLHEAAHGIVARWLGDDTASRMGRVSLNPLAHIDPFGTIILPGMLLLAGTPFLFGYAKPVPVDFARLKPARLGQILVAGAGPAMNILLALGSGYLLHMNPSASTLGNDILVYSLQINIMLAVFNMIPILPLDGGRVLNALLPRPLQILIKPVEKYGILILLGLLLVPMVTNFLLGHPVEVLREILLPPYTFLLSKILILTGHGGL